MMTCGHRCIVESNRMPCRGTSCTLTHPYHINLYTLLPFRLSSSHPPPPTIGPNAAAGMDVTGSSLSNGTMSTSVSEHTTKSQEIHPYACVYSTYHPHSPGKLEQRRETSRSRLTQGRTGDWITGSVSLLLLEGRTQSCSPPCQRPSHHHHARTL